MEIDNKINLAREIQSDLINNGKDYFLISVGLNGNNSGHTVCWDENNKQPLNLILLGLSTIIGRSIRLIKEEKDKQPVFRDIIEKILQLNNMAPSLEDLFLSFKDKFCLCTFIQKNGCVVDQIPSDDVTGDDFIKLITYTYYSVVTQLGSVEDRTEFFIKMSSSIKRFLDLADAN